MAVYNMWNQSKSNLLCCLTNFVLVVRVTLAIMIDKVLATQVASPKLPYPLPGSGRRAETLA